MKKYFYIVGIHLLSTTIIYSIIYLIFSFIIWEFKNPFQWIIDLPILSNTNRFLIIFYYLFYNVISLLIITINRNKIKKLIKL